MKLFKKLKNRANLGNQEELDENELSEKIDETEDKNITDSEDNIIQDEIPLAKRKGRIPKSMVKSSQEYLSHVLTLRLICLLLSAGLGLCIYTISVMPSQIIVKYAPQLRDGATLKLGEFPKASIISDVQYLWLAINTWEKGGLDEVNGLVWRYSNFLSPEFKAQLEKENKLLSKRGSLDRIRNAHAVPGQLFEFKDRVVEVTADSWIVYLDVILEESTPEGQLIRKPTYRYSIMVERYTTNLNINPIGLRLTGFRDAPLRIND